MSLSLCTLDSSSFPAWDRFVEESNFGTIFHSTRWLSLLSKNVEVTVIKEDNEIVAGMALAKTSKSGVTGFHIPPYTQYFSPLYGKKGDKRISISIEHECITLLLNKLKTAGHIDFKLPAGHHTILPYHWQGFESSVRITHIIQGTREDYLKYLNKNKLRELRKLQDLVFNNEIAIDDHISENELLFLLRQTGERKGYNTQSSQAIKFVMNAGDSFAKKITIRSHKHGVLAFGFFPYDNKAVYNLINASVRVNDPVLKTVNLLLLYQAIEFALTTGRIFDFEGSMLKGVEAFCRLMGGTQVPCYRVQKSSSLRYSLMRAANQIKNDRKKT